MKKNKLRDGPCWLRENIIIINVSFSMFLCIIFIYSKIIEVGLGGQYIGYVCYDKKRSI